MAQKPIDARVLLNQTDMAAACYVSVNAFKNWNVVVHSTQGKQKMYLVADVVQNRLDSAGHNQETPTVTQAEQAAEKHRLVTEQADEKALKNEIVRRDLVPIDFMLWFSTELARMIGDRLNTLPLDMKRMLRLPDSDTEKIRAVCADVGNAVASMGETDQVQDMINDYIEGAKG